MKKIEIKEIGAKSAFKATVYLSLIPLAFMSAIGILITIIGLAIGRSAMLAAGIPYIILPIIFLFIYGLIGMLSAYIYSKFAMKFGGLEISIEEKDQK